MQCVLGLEYRSDLVTQRRHLLLNRVLHQLEINSEVVVNQSVAHAAAAQDRRGALVSQSFRTMTARGLHRMVGLGSAGLSRDKCQSTNGQLTVAIAVSGSSDKPDLSQLREN